MDYIIGIIGIGEMGTPIANNIINAGYTVYGFDLSGERMEWLKSAGGIPCGGIEEVAQNAQVVITCLPSSEAFIKTANELIKCMKPGSFLFEMGTTTIYEMKRIAANFGEKGIEVLDAPMSGGPGGVAQKRLQVFVGGKREVFERFKPLFADIGGEDMIYYCGESGYGQVGKGVNQLCLGLESAVATEILAFARLENLDFELIKQMFGGKFPILSRPQAQIERGGHPGVKFRELPYYIENAKESGYELPITKAVYDFMEHGDFIAFDDHRKAPSFFHELTKKAKKR